MICALSNKRKKKKICKYLARSLFFFVPEKNSVRTPPKSNLWTASYDFFLSLLSAFVISGIIFWLLFIHIFIERRGNEGAVRVVRTVTRGHRQRKIIYTQRSYLVEHLRIEMNEWKKKKKEQNCSSLRCSLLCLWWMKIGCANWLFSRDILASVVCASLWGARISPLFGTYSFNRSRTSRTSAV